MEQSPPPIDSSAIRNLLNGLILLQSHIRLYGAHNANSSYTTTRLLGFLEKLFAQQDTITIFVVRHAFMFGEELLDRKNRNFEKFANSLFTHGIAAISLHHGVSEGELHAFLQLVARRPAETWDEGGMEQCLRSRQVALITVREMAEDDFTLTDNLTDIPADELQLQRSLLWENFALSLLHGLQLPDAEAGNKEPWMPGQLAERINSLLQERAEAEQQWFSRDASRFLIALKHEKIRFYRAAALHNLSSFVSSLTPGLRRMFLGHAFTLNLDADLAEGFLRGLSEKAILDVFQHASSAGDYVPPVILKLLGKLAQERGLVEYEDVTALQDAGDTTLGHLKELFKADEFDKYVPMAYQTALIAILQKESLPIATTQALEQLKTTLEPAAIEQHLGEVVGDILGQSADERHLDGLCVNLLGTLRFCQSMRDYRQIARLYALVCGNRANEKLRTDIEAFLASPEFASDSIDDLQSIDQLQAEALWGLIIFLPGPFIDPLLDKLGTETNRSLRLVYLKGLLKLGRGCIGPVVGRLADHRWYVVRNMIYLLREFGDASILPDIRRCLNHPHAKVQVEALRTCLLFRDERATPFLLQALAAKSDAELVSTINLASLSRNAQVVARLVDLLQSGTLLDYQLEVKKAAVRALASSAPEQCLPLYAKVLGSRNIMHAHAHEQLKLEVVAALAKLPSDKAKELLQTQTRSDSAELALTARLTLKKMAGAAS